MHIVVVQPNIALLSFAVLFFSLSCLHKVFRWLRFGQLTVNILLAAFRFLYCIPWMHMYICIPFSAEGPTCMYVNLQTHRNEYSQNWPNAQFNLCHEKNYRKNVGK